MAHSDVRIWWDVGIWWDKHSLSLRVQVMEGLKNLIATAHLDVIVLEAVGLALDFAHRLPVAADRDAHARLAKVRGSTWRANTANKQGFTKSSTA